MTEYNADAIVIGAGMTGLSCALSLSRKGKKVVVLESEDYCGGLLSSYRFPDFSVERYYHHFFRYDLPLIQLIDELGLSDTVDWKKASTGYYYKGEVFNLDTPREIFLYRYLTFFDKIRLSIAVLRIKRMGDFTALDKVTAREWLLKNTGQGVYHNFFEPLLKSKFGSAADQISAAWLCARLKLRSNRKVSGEELGYFRQGFDVVIDGLCREIGRTGTIRTGHRVTKIVRDTTGVRGVLTEQGEFSAPVVVSTISPSQLLPLADFSGEYRRKLELNRSQSVVCALFGMKSSLLGTYWLNIRSETLPFALLIEHTNFHDTPAYGGQKILYAAAYQDGPHHPLYQMPDEQIVARFIDGLESEFGLVRENILWTRLAKAAAVGPIYTVNFLQNLLDQTTPIPGLFIGGMMTSYPERGISVSIQQGALLADRAVAFRG
jgi:protoporphyrinogen oxidase